MTDLRGMITCVACGFDWFENEDSEGTLYIFGEDDLPRCAHYCYDHYLDAKEEQG